LSTDNAGGTAVDLIDFGAVTKANYTHTGTGALTWDGQNLTGNQVIKTNVVQATADTITGGAGNDNLTGNEGTDSLTGGAANDTLTGNGGVDTILGGDGNDIISAGNGADIITGGLGVDSITLTETTSAADTINISAGAVGTATDNESEDVVGTSASVVDDRGQDTITGFDSGNDTIAITATNVGSFDHTANLAVSAPADAGISATTTGTLNSFVKNTLFIALDADTDYDDDDDVVITFNDFKLNGVDQLAASATDYLTVADVSGRISYNLTGDAGGSDVVVTGDLADTITMGAGADSLTPGGGADKIYYTFVTPANAATESGAATGDTDYVLNTAGDTINGFVSGTDKIYIKATAVTNAKGTEADTLLTIGAAGTITNAARFVEITAAFDGTTGDAVTDLAAATTTAVESADSV
jgi:Ca2+-binding RTX toxin-like protein